MIKCEFHCHAKEDIMDKIPYSYRTLFPLAKKMGYDFLTLTFHERVYFNSDVKYFAKKYGIITCSGVEANIEGADVLLYDINPLEFSKIKTFDDCKDYFCMAPHPFYPVGRCLNENAIKHSDIFDAIEISSVHAPILNRWNNMARNFAEKINVPIIATGDCHRLWQLNKSYTFVDCSSDNPRDIFEAVRKKKCRPFQTKGSYVDLSRFVVRSVFEDVYNVATTGKSFIMCK